MKWEDLDRVAGLMKDDAFTFEDDGFEQYYVREPYHIEVFGDNEGGTMLVDTIQRSRSPDEDDVIVINSHDDSEDCWMFKVDSHFNLKEFCHTTTYR